MRKPLVLALLFLLSACGAAVNYGPVRHAELVQDAQCNPASTDASAIAGKDYFIVTSRLPDCRSADIRLTNHRSDIVRFGRFAPPVKKKTSAKAAPVKKVVKKAAPAKNSQPAKKSTNKKLAKKKPK